MTIKAKDELTLQIEDAEATVRAAAQLYFSRKRARWLATNGAKVIEGVVEAIHQGGASEIGMERVVRMIEAADD
jgi:hypothetical protein